MQCFIDLASCAGRWMLGPPSDAEQAANVLGALRGTFSDVEFGKVGRHLSVVLTVVAITTVFFDTYFGIYNAFLALASFSADMEFADLSSRLEKTTEENSNLTKEKSSLEKAKQDLEQAARSANNLVELQEEKISSIEDVNRDLQEQLSRADSSRLEGIIQQLEEEIKKQTDALTHQAEGYEQQLDSLHATHLAQLDALKASLAEPHLN